MPTGRYLNDGAVPTLTVAGIDATNDRFLVHDASASAAVQVAASQILNRLLTTTDRTVLGTLAAIASVDLAADELLVWDNSATAFVRMTAEQVIGRVLNRANITGLSNFSAGASVDQALDRFLLWDDSAAVFRTMTAAVIFGALLNQATSHQTATPVTVTTASHNGYVLTNYGAALAITFNLPAATVGTRFSFARVANYSMYLDPSGSETIGGGAAGKYLEIQSAGRVDLRCIVAGDWLIDNETALVDWEP